MSHTNDSTVTILLSTYNGAAYLREQLDSILNQSFDQWILLIRDDGSSDTTPSLIEEYRQRDTRIQLMQDTYGNLGPAKSFFKLLQRVQTDFFMFCDQDDVWAQDKIQKSLQLISANAVPQLGFTDLSVVDVQLKEIHPSFMEYSRFETLRGKSFEMLLMQNIVVGCTLVGNRSLLNLYLEKPEPVTAMHDWWLALLCSAFGSLHYLPEQTVRYRQHSSNSLGAKPSNLRRYIGMLLTERPWIRARRYFNLLLDQADSFLDSYGTKLPSEKRNALLKLCACKSRPWLTLLPTFVGGLRMHKLDRNVALYLSILPFFRHRSG